MKITDIKLLILEQPGEPQPAPLPMLGQVPNLRRIQWSAGPVPNKKKAVGPPTRPHQGFLEVHTDEGITGRCTSTLGPAQIPLLRAHVVGEDPTHREHIWQMLFKGTRWLRQKQGWHGDLDTCLWDIAGKVAGLPVHALIGKVRDRFPVYLTSSGPSLQDYLDTIEHGKEFGVNAYKFHTYKGGKADMPILEKTREVVGPDYDLINDPVCSYDLREAIEVGRLMEELDFIWLEEPMYEAKMSSYQKLCDALDMPVMSTENLMHDVGITAEWLIQGATDFVRADAIAAGVTSVLKLAHLAELHDTQVELAGPGGLFGHVHAHLGCCIDNNDYYEYFHQGSEGLRKWGEPWGMTNAPLIVDGHIAPNDLPGWGAEYDEEQFKSLIAEVH